MVAQLALTSPSRPHLNDITRLVVDARAIPAHIPAASTLQLVITHVTDAIMEVAARIGLAGQKASLLCSTLNRRADQLVDRALKQRREVALRAEQYPPVYCICNSDDESGFMVYCEVSILHE